MQKQERHLGKGFHASYFSELLHKSELYIFNSDSIVQMATLEIPQQKLSLFLCTKLRFKVIVC